MLTWFPNIQKVMLLTKKIIIKVECMYVIEWRGGVWGYDGNIVWKKIKNKKGENGDVCFQNDANNHSYHTERQLNYNPTPTPWGQA